MRLCIYSRPVTLLDTKGDVVRELIREAGRRGVRIKLVLLDRAFFTVECINLLKELELQFIMPCVCNERVKEAVVSFGKEGRISFSIHDNSKNEASFTMVVYWSREKWKHIPFATNVEGNVRKLVRTIPKQYRMRWGGIETSFRKVKEVFPMTTSPLPAIRLAYFMTAMILYNLWQIVNIMLITTEDWKGKMTGGYRVTMPFKITVLCAHLNGRL